MIFEGDWREYPEMVAHVEDLRLWARTVEVLRSIEPGENGKFPESEVKLLTDPRSANALWTIYGGFSDGDFLVPGVVESPYSWLYILTKNRLGEIVLPSDLFDSVSGIWLDPSFDCPSCSGDDDVPSSCVLCEGDENLVLPHYILDNQGEEYYFPTGSYFSET